MKRGMIGLAAVLAIAVCGFARTHMLKTNTATKIIVGPFYDAVDKTTPKLALTHDDIDCELVWENAGSPVLIELTLTPSGGANDMALITGSENGYWELELTAANVNYLGTGTISFRDPNTVFCPFDETLLARPAHVHDGLILGTDYLQVDAVEVGGAMPLSSTDVKDQCDASIETYGLHQLLAAPIADVNVVDNSALASLASATAVWTTFTSGSHSLEAIADSVGPAPPPESTGMMFTVVATSTASMVTISVGDVAIPANFWKDCLVRVDHTVWSAGSYSRVASSTAQTGGKVILYLSSTLPFTPAPLTDKVYIEGWSLRPADLPPRGSITY